MLMMIFEQISKRILFFGYLEFSVHDLNTQCCLLLCYKTITRANIFTKVVWNKPTFPAKASILDVHIAKCNIYHTSQYQILKQDSSDLSFKILTIKDQDPLLGFSNVSVIWAAKTGVKLTKLYFP